MNFQLLVTFCQFLLATALIMFSTRIIVKGLLKRRHLPDFFLSCLLVFIFLAQFVTSFAGLFLKLNSSVVLLLSVIIFSPLFYFWKTRKKKTFSPVVKKNEPFSLSFLLIFILTIFFAIALAVALRFSPVRHDVMTYHLFFPANWVLFEKIFYTPILFGDMSHTYAPSSGMAFFAFLSLPFHGDQMSRVGQFPFLIMGALAVYRLTVKMGAKKSGALIPVFLAVISPVLFRQGFTAQEDLAMGGAFVTALYFLWEYKDSPSVKTSMLFGASIGLAIEIKFIALTFSILLIIPFIYFLLFSTGRAKKDIPIHALAAFGVAIAAGGFWLIRNYFVTGNPLFPLDMPPFFHGLYNKSAMTKSVFHIPNIKSIPPVWIHAYGFWMFICASLAFLLSIILIVKKKIKGFGIYVILMPVFLTIIGFIMIPYNSQFRFLLPAVFLSFISFAFFENRSPTKWVFRSIWMLLALAGIYGAAHPFKLGEIVITKAPLLPKVYFLHQMGLLLVGAAIIFALGKVKIAPLKKVAILFFPLFFLVLFMEFGLYKNSPKQIIVLRQNLSKEYPISGWGMVNNIVEPSVVAYTGTNTPYYLLGRPWRHKVIYVNVTGQTGYLLHDFYKTCRKKGNCPDPGGSDKPPIMREPPNKELWLAGLAKHKADFLFVAPLGKMDRAGVAHDKDGFPVERIWADSMPEIFRLIGRNHKFRLYSIK